jgi:transcriptional regulator with XRE-family HTH domain
MRPQERLIRGFRRRLLRLIEEQYEGKYTVLARRAGLPISSVQHILQDAKHLPGGEPLQKLASTLGVTVQYLATGHEGVSPLEPPVPPAPAEATQEERLPSPAWEATHVTLPVFRCGCPGPCPLTRAVPPELMAGAGMVLGTALLAEHATHRLLALQVTPNLPSGEWPVGAQVILDWDARTPAWEALVLLHDAGQCQLGHVTQSGDRLLYTRRPDEPPILVTPAGRVLATVIAAVTPL